MGFGLIRAENKVLSVLEIGVIELQKIKDPYLKLRKIYTSLTEIVEKYVHKGDKLYIEGRLRYSSYDDKQGQRKYVTEIWADNMEMLTPKDSKE